MNPFFWTQPSKHDILTTEIEVFHEQKNIHKGTTTVTTTNPYIYSVTDTRIILSKKFKEIFMEDY